MRRAKRGRNGRQAAMAVGSFDKAGREDTDLNFIKWLANGWVIRVNKSIG